MIGDDGGEHLINKTDNEKKALIKISSLIQVALLRKKYGGVERPKDIKKVVDGYMKNLSSKEKEQIFSKVSFSGLEYLGSYSKKAELVKQAFNELGKKQK